jgi:hypothetical protein
MSLMYQEFTWVRKKLILCAEGAGAWSLPAPFGVCPCLCVIYSVLGTKDHRFESCHLDVIDEPKVHNPNLGSLMTYQSLLNGFGKLRIYDVW